jgi:hypothetical protein
MRRPIPSGRRSIARRIGVALAGLVTWAAGGVLMATAGWAYNAALPLVPAGSAVIAAACLVLLAGAGCVCMMLGTVALVDGLAGERR